jgi:hypothetical protein
VAIDDDAAVKWKAELERLKDLFREAKKQNDGTHYAAYADILKHIEWKQDKWRIFS